MKPQEIEKVIAQIETVPGRMDEVKSKDGYSVFIDYAHTPDALEKAISTLKDIE